MKNLILSFCFLTISISIFATHVVGGDFQIQWVSQNNYHVKLRFYRDCFNGAVSMPSTMSIGVYDAITHSLIGSQTLSLTSSSTVPLGDPCYTPPASTCIEEGIFESTSNLYLPDSPNGNGYYLQTQINARNSLAMNVTGAVSGNGTMVWFAMIPDPALGQNSSPDFGDYPLDAYFCTGYDKSFQYPITDADGDSLVYSLVTPLDANVTSNGNFAGTGGYPFYPDLSYQGTFSLADFVGGINPMTMDPISGVIIAGPDMTGFFTFAVRVEEYRNGIKIGEVRRDVQYASLPCTINSVPQIDMPDTVEVYVDSNICVDMLVYDQNSSDTLYAQVTSNDFDVSGTYVPPVFNSGISYTYNNWNNSGLDMTFSVLDSLNGFAQGIGEVPMRFCWSPLCEDLDSNFHLNVLAYSEGCAGSDTSEQEVVISVVYSPPPTLLNVPSTITISLGDEMCIDLLAIDSIHVNDTLYLQPYSGDFDFVTTFVPPTESGGSFYYQDFISPGNTLTMSNYTYSGFTPGAIGQVGLRFCWTTDCDYIFQKEFDLNYRAFSTACGSDTIFANSHIEVDPPLGFVEPLPNVFTPNGDGDNDLFKLKGANDPCYDFMAITIFNRWGQKVFASIDSNFEWDGTHNGKGHCKAGTYYVLIDGSYGSTYDQVTGERVPNLVKDEYYIQLLR